MQNLSVFDIFKIGVGPSSSHTMGPWNAAAQFAADFVRQEPRSVQVELYGSLAKTGRGHATDVAILLGLSGYDAKTICVDDIDSIVAAIKNTRQIMLAGSLPINFDCKKALRFCTTIELPEHPNAMKFIGETESGQTIERIVYSIGGGFIVRDGQDLETTDIKSLPLSIFCSADML